MEMITVVFTTIWNTKSKYGREILSVTSKEW